MTEFDARRSAEGASAIFLELLNLMQEKGLLTPADIELLKQRSDVRLRKNLEHFGLDTDQS